MRAVGLARYFETTPTECKSAADMLKPQPAGERLPAETFGMRSLLPVSLTKTYNT